MSTEVQKEPTKITPGGMFQITRGAIGGWMVNIHNKPAFFSNGTDTLDFVCQIIMTSTPFERAETKKPEADPPQTPAPAK